MATPTPPQELSSRARETLAAAGWSGHGRLNSSDVIRWLHDDAGFSIVDPALEFLSRFEGIAFYTELPNHANMPTSVEEANNLWLNSSENRRGSWVNFDVREVVSTYQYHGYGELFEHVLQQSITPLGEVLNRDGLWTLIMDAGGVVYYVIPGTIAPLGTCGVDAINRLIDADALHKTSRDMQVINFSMSEVCKTLAIEW